MVGIYKITSPTGRVYIGQSLDVNKRAKQYQQGYNCKSQTKLHKSLVKYSFSAHIFEIIEECKVVELNIRERYWQDFYNVLGRDGLNCRLQSTEDKSGYLSDETKVAIREAAIGRRHSTETKQKISEAKIGKKNSQEHIEKIRQAQIGRVKGPFTEEHRQKLSAVKKGVLKTKTHKDALKGPRGPQKNPRKKGYTLSDEHKANMKGPRGPQKNPKRNKI